MITTTQVKDVPSLYQFMQDNPITCLCLAVFALIFVLIIVKVILLLVNRLLRTVNILFRGWPPPHLDADGDFHPMLADESIDI